MLVLEETDFPAAGLRLMVKDNLPIFPEDSTRMTRLVGILYIHTSHLYGRETPLICLTQLPGGSSSGVFIAINAGLAAIGVGADTEASLTAPAISASLYSIRPTTGIVAVEGTVPCLKSFDTVGPIGKSVKDVADLLSALVESDQTAVLEGSYATATANYQEKAFRVGTLDPQI